MSDPLKAAAERLRRAHGRVLGALEAAKTDATSRRDSGRLAAQAALDRQRAIVRNQAAQAVTEHSLRARDAAAMLTAGASGPLAVAENVMLGRLSTPGRPLGVNEDVEAPFVVPLLGHGNIVIEADTMLAKPLVERIVWQALSGTAPGQLDVIGYDPKLTSALSPFSRLRSASDDALQVLNRATELDRVVQRLVSDVQRVNDTLRGSGQTLIDFRRAAGHPVERFRLVVLLDYPAEIDEPLHRQVLSLAKAGPDVGLAFVFVVPPGGAGAPSWWKSEDVRSLGAVIRAEQETLCWAAHPTFEITLGGHDAASVARAVDELAERASAASAPRIPFERVQPLSTGWEASSADRLQFAVGLSGSAVAEVTLGDERDQRHNILITGAIGQGKSNLLKVIVHSLAQRYPPEELELHLLDFKEGVTLYPLAPRPESPDFLPHARVLGLESDRDFGLAVLRHIEAEFSRRAQLFRPHGDSISRYRSAVPAAIMPRIVVVIDEFHMLFDPNDQLAEAAAQLLEAIARRGRSYGVHLILASQTISGISALLSREGGIFAQFPIRLALKNAAQESFATLGPGNDAAARLRVRGEAVLNLDYGHIDSNRQVLIAAVDDDELARLRRRWWESARSRVDAPLVFDGNRRIRGQESIEWLRNIRASAASESSTPVVLLGYPIDVSGRPLAIPLAAEPGRNLAIVGAGENPQSSAAADPENNAIGVLQLAAVSLALQHPAGDAEFVSFEMIDETALQRNNHQNWLDLMAALGYTVERVGRDVIADYLQESASDLEGRDPDAPPRYLLGFGLDRATMLDAPDVFAHRPAEDLQQVLRAGPVKHVHLLGWWANAATFRSHIGFGGEGFIDAMLVLRLDQSSTQDLLSSPFVSWSVRNNRGLLSDRTQLAEPTTIIPFSPLTARVASVLSQTDWEV